MELCEDQIDVDDSDLQFVLRPHIHPSSSLPQSLPRCLHPCSQIPSSSQNLEPNPSVPRQSQLPKLISEKNQNEEEEHFPEASTSRPLIPGPAGAVQAAMRRQSATSAAKRSLSEEGGKDDGDLCIMSEEEGDFKLNSWLYCLSFLGKGTNSSFQYPINSINAQRSAIERIPQVVGIVKSCTPNGLGDLFITLKDPTGTIGAVIHRKVLSEGNIGGDISVGCVFILKQVVAFCPAHSPCYLNITLKNVVKLIAKDCGQAEKGKQLQTELPAGEGWLNTIKTAKVTGTAGNIFAAASGAKSAAKPDARTGEPKSLISRASVAEWTDEQLEKLFSDYDDDTI